MCSYLKKQHVKEYIIIMSENLPVVAAGKPCSSSSSSSLTSSSSSSAHPPTPTPTPMTHTLTHPEQLPQGQVEVYDSLDKHLLSLLQLWNNTHTDTSAARTVTMQDHFYLINCGRMCDIFQEMGCQGWRGWGMGTANGEIIIGGDNAWGGGGGGNASRIMGSGDSPS